MWNHQANRLFWTVLLPFEHFSEALIFMWKEEKACSSSKDGSCDWASVVLSPAHARTSGIVILLVYYAVKTSSHVQEEHPVQLTSKSYKRPLWSIKNRPCESGSIFKSFTRIEERWFKSCTWRRKRSLSPFTAGNETCDYVLMDWMELVRSLHRQVLYLLRALKTNEMWSASWRRINLLCLSVCLCCLRNRIHNTPTVHSFGKEGKHTKH